MVNNHYGTDEINRSFYIGIGFLILLVISISLNVYLYIDNTYLSKQAKNEHSLAMKMAQLYHLKK